MGFGHVLLYYMFPKMKFMSFEKFINALKPNGIWYMSFKRGDKERTKDGRFFNDYTISDLKDLLQLFNKELHINYLWTTVDKRPDRDEY